MIKEKNKKLVKLKIISILFVLFCVLSFSGPRIFALGFNPGQSLSFNGPDSLFIQASKSSINVYQDSADSDRSIAVFSYTFDTSYSSITMVFDSCVYSGGGSPAVMLNEFNSTSYITAQGFTSLFLDGTNNINDNLIYFDSPTAAGITTVYLYVSIDKTLDSNYINNQTLISNVVMFSPLSPYQLVSGISSISPEKYQEAILMSRYTGYLAGYDEGLIDGHTQGYTDANLDYNAAYNVGLDDGIASGYQDGYDAGIAEQIGTPFISSMVSGIADITKIELIPGIAIGWFFLIPFLFPFLKWFLKSIAG